MVATVLLLGCVLAPAQLPPRPSPVHPPSASGAALRNDWVLTPKLVRGQELVYRGTYSETAGSDRVEFQRAYRIEARFFGLETTPRGSELAGMTLLYTRDVTDTQSGKSPSPSPLPSRKSTVSASSVRLERLTLDLQGKIAARPGIAVTIPLDGAPSLELGPFLEVPRGKLSTNQGWEVSETGRPLLAWRIVGTETLAGQSCIKVVGLQQSDDWEQPRADRSAWRRRETVWINPRTGFTARVERVLEQREPARRDISRSGTLRYDLESTMQYPSLMAQDRRSEILQALKLREEARPLVSDPLRNTKAIQALQRRITSQIESTPPTPYRECVLQVLRTVEAAGRGEVVTISHVAEAAPATPAPSLATIGKPAPEFLASEVAGTANARLSKWKGKPIVLVFYHPESVTAPELLRFAQDLQTRWGNYATVVGLSVSDDKKKILAQRDELKLTFPLLHGGGLRVSYKVETTPKVVVIDASGLVRGMYFGWGRETANEVTAELRPLLTAR